MIDFHNHTVLCGHAEGTIDEYIQKAIEKGVKILGFSDHAPLPEHLRDGITMHPDEVEKYINLVLSKKEEYQNKIDIRLGFEVDFPLHKTFNDKYYNDTRIDYLIGSCHYLEEWPVDHPDSIPGYEERGVDNVFNSYYSSLQKMTETGLFNIVGHFDLVKKYGHRSTKDFSNIIKKIASTIASNDMAVELNLAGLRKPVGEIYPSKNILKILFEENVPITIGSDSHCPDDITNGLDKALTILKSIGYKKLSEFKNKKRYDWTL